MFFNRSCIMFLNSVLFCLLSFSKVSAEVDSNPNKDLEKRLHEIYEKHYDKPVLDSEWFTVIEAIEVQRHIVSSGDTLWGISKVYFGDGNYWSKLWSVNKRITNPHLIFVGDVIRFTTGSFEEAPGIDIEKSGAPPTNLQADAPSMTESIPPGLNLPAERGLAPIPDFFEESKIVEKTEEAPIEFIPRPAMQYKSEFVLTDDFLDAEPESVGYVKSLGEYRVITAEGSIIVLKASSDLTIGGTYSILKQDVGRIDSGYPVHVRASVSIQKKLDEDLYEGKVIRQYEAIQKYDILSTYEVLTVNANVAGITPTETAIRVVNDAKSMWSAGDAIFLKVVDDGNLNVGDVLRINNKFVDNIEFYISNGFIKVVTVHPPYATGVVVTSREHIRSNSVSSPTYTGWRFW